jgi:hypothetical protein
MSDIRKALEAGIEEAKKWDEERFMMVRCVLAAMLASLDKPTPKATPCEHQWSYGPFGLMKDSKCFLCGIAFQPAPQPEEKLEEKVAKEISILQDDLEAHDPMTLSGCLGTAKRLISLIRQSDKGKVAIDKQDLINGIKWIDSQPNLPPRGFIRALRSALEVKNG